MASKAKNEKPDAQPQATIRVEAVRAGYYGDELKKPGAQFLLKPGIHGVTGEVVTAESLFSKKWMKRLGPGKPVVPELREPTPVDEMDADTDDGAPTGSKSVI